MARTRQLFGVCCAAAAACNALNGAADLVVESAEPGADAASDVAQTVDAPNEDARDASDAATDAVVDAPVSRYRAAVLADGPVAYFRLGDSSGASSADETAHYAATYLAGTTTSVTGALAGDLDPAIRLAGDGGGVLVATDALNFAGHVPFSLEAWVKPDRVDGAYRFVFHRGGRDEAGVRQDYGINIQDTQGLTFERFVDGQQGSARAAPPSVGAWHHIVGVYDSASLILYVDGIVVAQSADARDLRVSSSPFRIGATNLPGIAGPVAGDLDEVAVYDKVLSPASIQAHLAAAK